MNLSTVIQEEEYWYRRLERQLSQRNVDRNRGKAVAKYHRQYIRHIIKQLRLWRDIYINWDSKTEAQR